MSDGIETPWQQERRLQKERSSGLHGRDAWYDHDEEGVEVEGSSKFYTEPRTDMNEAVLAIRLEYEYSAGQLARVLGCHASTVWKMERKRYVPSYDVVVALKRLMDARGMSKAHLLRKYLQPGAQRGIGRIDSTIESEKYKSAFPHLSRWMKQRRKKY